MQAGGEGETDRDARAFQRLQRRSRPVEQQEERRKKRHMSLVTLLLLQTRSRHPQRRFTSIQLLLLPLPLPSILHNLRLLILRPHRPGRLVAFSTTHIAVPCQPQRHHLLAAPSRHSRLRSLPSNHLADLHSHLDPPPQLARCFTLRIISPLITTRLIQPQRPRARITTEAHLPSSVHTLRPHEDAARAWSLIAAPSSLPRRARG